MAEGGDAMPMPPERAPVAAKPGSLRDFVLANFPLLGAIGGLTGIATFVAALPIYAGWIGAYLTFLLLAAAVLDWVELLAQWPSDLLLYQGPPPQGTSWRLVGFAYAVQLTMVGFLAGLFLRFPKLAVPALGTAIGVGLWRVLLPQRVKSARGAPLLTLIIALLVAIAVDSLVHPAHWTIFEDTEPNEP